MDVLQDSGHTRRPRTDAEYVRWCDRRVRMNLDAVRDTAAGHDIVTTWDRTRVHTAPVAGRISVPALLRHEGVMSYGD